VSRNAGKLAAAMKVLLALEELDPDVGLAVVWDLIENEVPKHERTCAGARCRSTPVRCPRTRSPA
jgi:hypothetical protein